LACVFGYNLEPQKAESTQDVTRLQKINKMISLF